MARRWRVWPTLKKGGNLSLGAGAWWKNSKEGMVRTTARNWNVTVVCWRRD